MAYSCIFIVYCDVYCYSAQFVIVMDFSFELCLSIKPHYCID